MECKHAGGRHVRTHRAVSNVVRPLLLPAAACCAELKNAGRGGDGAAVPQLQHRRALPGRRVRAHLKADTPGHSKQVLVLQAAGAAGAAAQASASLTMHATRGSHHGRAQRGRVLAGPAVRRSGAAQANTPKCRASGASASCPARAPPAAAPAGWPPAAAAPRHPRPRVPRPPRCRPASGWQHRGRGAGGRGTAQQAPWLPQAALAAAAWLPCLAPSHAANTSQRKSLQVRPQWSGTLSMGHRAAAMGAHPMPRPQPTCRSLLQCPVPPAGAHWHSCQPGGLESAQKMGTSLSRSHSHLRAGGRRLGGRPGWHEAAMRRQVSSSCPQPRCHACEAWARWGGRPAAQRTRWCRCGRRH